MSELKAGIARCDLTPPSGTLLFGYGISRPGHEVADRLAATALVLRSGETTAALVSIDWCLIEEEDVAVFRAAISAATGIAPRDITLSATHTHSAPITVTAWGWGARNPDYLESARRNIVEAVVEAQQRLVPVRAGIGVTQTDAGVNRRQIDFDGSLRLGFNEWGPCDRDLTVVRFEGENGPVAQIVHLAAHPTARGLESSVSRDWPGVMTDRLETVTKAPTLFINGAFGDVAPRTSVGGSPGDGPFSALEVGLRAAADAVRAWNGITEFRDLELQTLHADLELPYAPLPSPEEARRELAARPKPDNPLGAEACEWNYWNAVIQAHDAPARLHRVFQQTVTRLGPLAIVPFGGEVFAEIGLRLKQDSPVQHTLVAGATNGSHGYYVTRESRARGGYEVWVARAYGAYLLCDTIDDVLVDENLKLLRRFE